MHETSTTSSYREGRKRGRRWASAASEEEVQRIGNLRARLGEDWQDFFHGPRDGFTPGERLYFQMWPADEGDRGKANAFWKSVLWERAEEVARNPTWVRGFAEGLLTLQAEASRPPLLTQPDATSLAEQLSPDHFERIRKLVQSIGWEAESQRAWLMRNKACSFRALTADRADKLIDALMKVELGFADSVEIAETMLNQKPALRGAGRPILRIVSRADDEPPGRNRHSLAR